MGLYPYKNGTVKTVPYTVKRADNIRPYIVLCKFQGIKQKKALPYEVPAFVRSFIYRMYILSSSVRSVKRFFANRSKKHGNNNRKNRVYSGSY